MVEVLESELGTALEAPIDAPGGSASEDAEALASVHRPEPGETLVVPTAAGLLLVVEFDPTTARFSLHGNDFVLTLEDGAQVVFQGLISAAQGEDAPTVRIAGIDIGADVLVDQARTMVQGAEEEPVETAADQDGEGKEITDGGGSHDDDSFGDLIAGLIKQGIIGETDLGLGPIGSGDTELLLDAEFLSDGYLLSDDGGFVDNAGMFVGNDENIEALHVLDGGRALFSMESMIVTLNPDPSIEPGLGEGDPFVYESVDTEIDALYVTDFDIVGSSIVLNEIVVSTGGDVNDVNADMYFGPEDLFTFDVGTDTATPLFDTGTEINAKSWADILHLSDLLVTVDENNGDPGADADVDNILRIFFDTTDANALVDADGTVGGETFVNAGFVPGLAIGDTISVIVDVLGNSEAATAA